MANHAMGKLSKVFIMIIFLLGHVTNLNIEKGEYEVLEFYSGAARLAKLSSALGGKAAAMDCLYDGEGDNKTKNNAMDMCTNGGFLHLILFWLTGMFCLSPPAFVQHSMCVLSISASLASG